MTQATRQIIALSGGVGGAKLALGLSRCLEPEQLLVVANTGDDFEHLSLPISPDLDTVMYTLAGVNNQELGWGLAGESWQAMEALATLGGPTWFRLGDKDLATHLQRRALLDSGLSLSEATAELCKGLGVATRLLPMSDEPVRTYVDSDQGELSFQEYFVGRQCAPAVKSIEFRGLDGATAQPEWLQALASEETAAVIICPSNPFVSVAPMMSLAGVKEALRASPAPLVAVSPIVGGQAIKGPAAKMMAELNLPADALAVARYYLDIGLPLKGFVIDHCDRELAADIEALGLRVLVTQSIMQSLEDRIALAQSVLDFCAEI